jgi:dephospho-CoA kinase
MAAAVGQASGLRVGLTGGLASGKSTVARWLAEAGCTVVDADRLVAALYRPGEPGALAVRQLFGDGMLTAEGAVDPRRLSPLVFADADARQRLEAAIHPLVRQRFAAVAAGAALSPELRRDLAPVGAEPPADSVPASARVAVLEATRLVEAGYAPDFDLIVTVEASEAIRLQRAIERGMSAEDARARLRAQGDGLVRRAAAHWVISNEGDLATLRREVERLLTELTATARLGLDWQTQEGAPTRGGTPASGGLPGRGDRH